MIVNVGLVERSRSLDLWLLSAVAVGAVLRFATLDVQSYGHDEAVTAGRVLLPSLSGTLDMVESSERAPYLYYLFAWVWTRPFGLEEVGLRSLSALLGTATIPIVWLAARQLVSVEAARVSAWLVALSPFLVFYAQEARSYSLLVLLGAFALWFFARSLDEPSRWNLVGWAVFSALSLLTHYFALFAFLAQAGVLLWCTHARGRVAIAAGLPVVVGLILLPLALEQGSSHSDGSSAVIMGYRAVATAVVQLAAGERLGVSGVYTAIPFLGLLIASLVVGLGLLAWRHKAHGALACAAIGAAAFGGPLALSWVGGDGLAGNGVFSARNAVGAVAPLAFWSPSAWCLCGSLPCVGRPP